MRSASQSFYASGDFSPSPTMTSRTTRSNRSGNFSGLNQTNDEFAQTFERHHDIAATERRIRDTRATRAQTDRETGIESQQTKPTRPTLGQPAAAATFSAPPPTASLSSMLAASTGKRPKVARDFSTATYAPYDSTLASSPSPPPSSATSRWRGHQLFSGSDALQFRNWIKDVQQWRAIAAGVWFGAISLCIVHAFTISFSWPGWNPVDWFYAYWNSCPLVSHTLLAIWFAGLQGALLVFRAAQSRTDPSILFAPVVPRIWQSFDAAAVTHVALSTLLTALSGWMVMDILFQRSSLWHEDSILPADTKSASSDPAIPPVSEGVAFVIAGFLIYTIGQALKFVIKQESILVFPPIPNLSRSRLILPQLPRMLLKSLRSTIKFVLFFAVFIWTLIGRWIVPFLQRVERQVDGLEHVEVEMDGVEEELPQPVVSEVHVALLPSLAAAYHLLLIVALLNFLNKLAGHFISVFLTQPVDMRIYFLHALYDAPAVNENTTATALMLNGHGTSPQVDDRSFSHLNTCASHLSNPMVAASSSYVSGPNPVSNTLPVHLSLRWLVSIVSHPAWKQHANLSLFRDLAVILAPIDDTVPKVNRATGTLNLRGPAFEPVLSYALERVAAMVARMDARRVLVSSPPIDAFDPNSMLLASGANNTGTLGSLSFTAEGALTTTAFLSTQLDGAGLFFPSRSQQSALLLSDISLVDQCVQFVSHLAVRALEESGGATLPNGHSSLPSAFAGAGSQLTSVWLEPIISHLLSLSLSLESYIQSPHFVSPRQENQLEGHQITRSRCIHMTTSLDQSLYRLVGAYRQYLPELHLSTVHAARLGAYCTFNSK